MQGERPSAPAPGTPRASAGTMRIASIGPAATAPILVTGGAGYIGSHAVHALRDAGRKAVVVDNLSTGFRFAVPEDVPLYHGDIADTGLLARIFAEQWITFPRFVLGGGFARAWRGRSEEVSPA